MVKITLPNNKLIKLGAEKKPPLPETWAVLYVHPNSDGSKKLCKNCIMWSRDEKCSIHEPNIKVTKTMVCGYHVFGKPMPKRMEHEGMDTVDPKYSGLEEVGDGTNCGTCKYFVKKSEDLGSCRAVYDKGKQANVKTFGCCGRWEK